VASTNTRVWTIEEDERLKQLIEEHGSGKWVIGDLFVNR
jgi:hypothetical protein